MAGRFVRASKYRHVFGKSTRREGCYDNLRISRNAWDTNLIKVNPEYLAVNWEASGGGAFAVIPLNEKGRLPEQMPLFRGHTAPVLDTDWNPFNDRMIASASDDGKILMWQVPQDFTLYADEPDDVAPVSKLTGHSRKVGQVLFNPAAENILASASGDYTVKVWDVATGESSLTLKHNDIVQSLTWNANGSLMATTSRDKKLRIWDTRQEREAHCVAGHSGAKGSRVVWMGEHDRLATTGFSKMSARQLALWDAGNPSEPIGGFSVIDHLSGVCMPFWDDGTNCLYLAGKGDGNIRYYEYENDKFEYLSEYKSGDPQRGLAFVPRRGINVHENEVMRAYKTVNDIYIEPISFTVPRRAEVFQADIYPPATGLKPAVSASVWFSGKDGVPAKIDLESVYDGNKPVEVPAGYKPPQQASASSPSSTTPAAMKETGSAPSQKTSTTISDQKASISAMTNKYQDNEPSGDEADEPSNFEDIVKPVPKSIPAAAKVDTKVASPIIVSATKIQPNRPTPVSQATPRLVQPAAAAAPTTIPTSSGPISAVGAASDESNTGVQSSLAQITRLIETQTKTLNAQSDKIERLSREVDTLKMKLESGQPGQSERIRQLELELEAARS